MFYVYLFFLNRQWHLSWKMLLETTSLGIKKISVIEYGRYILVEHEVQDELEKCISLDKAMWKFFCDNIENIKVAVEKEYIDSIWRTTFSFRWKMG